ncbi:MAG: adenylosuccinate synthase [candidate division NC10 bacterium]|nr:adenylosuccinate synthase [candidate division NC10 bacterium]
MANIVVVGAQWGDEGKGKIVDFLCDHFDVVTRYQGGHNAGHTVVLGNHKYVLHMVPSGILHRGKICLLGNGVVIDPKELLAEMEQLRALGVEIQGNLLISKNAHLIMPYHKVMDLEGEARRGAHRIGTTGRGIGPCYVDKAARVGIRFGELYDPDLFRERLALNLREKRAQHPADSQIHQLDEGEIFRDYLSYYEQLKGFLVDGGLTLYRLLREGKSVLFEGAQGTLLDVDLGTYPYVTSSSSAVGGACIGTGIGPTQIDGVIGVTKAYTTRVGEGPFPTELKDEVGELLRERGSEYGASTGRPRRCGWFDAVGVRYSVRMNALSTLALMKLDVLDALDSIRICVGYRYRGEVLSEFPNETSKLPACQPIYEEWPGWKQSTVGVTSFRALPRPCQNYVRRMSELVESEFSIISTGPVREQTIVRNTPSLRKWKVL